jgi:hypothetical protein
VKNVQGNDEELDHGELCGWLEKDKGQTLLGGAVKPTRRFFMLRGGFIGYAKSELVRIYFLKLKLGLTR